MNASTLLDGLRFTLGILLAIISRLLSDLYSLLGLLVSLLVSPILYLVQIPLSVILWQVQIVLKFQGFLLYIGGALLTGIAVGVFLYLIDDALKQLLHLQPSPEPLSTGVVSTKYEPYGWESKIEDERFMSSTILEEEETSQVSD